MAMGLSSREHQVLAGLAVLVVLLAVVHEAVQLKSLGMAIQSQLLADHYSVLGVHDSASKDEITTAYRRANIEFQSKAKHEDAQLRRAGVVAAYEALMDDELRESYDRRRGVVKLGSGLLTTGVVVVPGLALLWCLVKLVQRTTIRNSFGVDTRSFEGKVTNAFMRFDVAVTVTLERGSTETKLGLRLKRALLKNGSPALEVEAVIPESAAYDHNRRIRAGLNGKEPVSWKSEMIWAGDMIVGCNGITAQEEMLASFAAATTLQLTLMRAPRSQALLPWITEADLRRQATGERWGCQMSPSQDSSDTLEVLGVEPDGPLARWNRLNPSLQICAGDRIVAVNGKLGGQRMIPWMKDQNTTEARWTVLRGVLMSPAPNEQLAGPFRKAEGRKLGIRVGRSLESRVNGSIVEPMGGAQIVVKEIVAGYVVDEWNASQPEDARIQQGALVLAVNGNTNPAHFATEFGKPVVQILTRLPMGACGEAAQPEAPTTAEAAAPRPSLSAALGSGTCPASAEAPAAASSASGPAARLACPSAPSLGGRALDSVMCLFKPAPFEEIVRKRLSSMQCEFEVTVSRTATCSRAGMMLQPMQDEIGGLLVGDIAADGMISLFNTAPAGLGRNPGVLKGDRLISVNGVNSPNMMCHFLGDANNVELNMVFSRPALASAPGLWEAVVERRPGEGWGMELREVKGRHAEGTGPLRIQDISPSMAVGRWNQLCGARGVWAIESGDIIVAVAPEVKYSKMVERLRTCNEVRLMVLRWHAGPALAGHDPESSPHAAALVAAFEVALEKKGPSDRLGLKLDPSLRERTRNAVQAVLPGGLVEAHNQRVAAMGQGEAVRFGDEVVEINGERDSTRFAARCADPVLRIRFERFATPCLADPAAPSAAAALVVAPVASPPVVAATVASEPSVVAVASAPSLGQMLGRAPAPGALTVVAPGVNASVTPVGVTPGHGASTMLSLPRSPAATAVNDGMARALAATQVIAATAVSPTTNAAAARAAAAAMAIAAAAAAASAAATEAALTAVAAANGEIIIIPPGGLTPKAEYINGCAASAPPPGRSAAEAKESFLLKAEVEQFKRRLASIEDGSKQSELKALNAERDELRRENEQLRAAAQSPKRTAADAAAERASKRAAEESSQKVARAVEEATQLRAEIARLRAHADGQDARLQETLGRSAQLADANARLLGENERLSSESAARPAANSLPKDSGGVSNVVFNSVVEQLTQLQELAASIHLVLADHDDDILM